MAKARTDAPCTHAEALAWFDFTGRDVLARTQRRGGPPAGALVGAVGSCGYRHVTVGGRVVLVHRLAWFAHHGVWPTRPLDHIDCDRTNSHWTNLREVTPQENSQNRAGARACNAVGVRNVRWPPSHQRAGKRPQAVVTIDGKCRSLGAFDTVTEAAAVAAAYMRANYPGYTERNDRPQPEGAEHGSLPN